MFEGAVAAILNRFLGKYVEDLDTEDFNVGIFSGDTCLTDLRLKPEALYQLGLPIRVELGLIGKISLKIPWAGLFSQPIILCVEDMYIVAVSEVFGSYDSEVHKRLIRAAKKKVLEDLEGEALLGPGFPSGIFDNFLSSLVKNFQITVNNVHVRYEERVSRKVQSACGICMQSLTMATTNNKWKPGVTPTNSTTIYQLIRVESFCIYMDPSAETSLQSDPSTWDFDFLLDWKDKMRRSLQTFGLNDQEFQFLVKPFTTKIKMIISKATETRDSRMLVDIVLQDVAMQVSKDQYITFLRLYDTLHRATVSRHNKKHQPNCTAQENPKSWWKYAHRVVLEQNVQPYTWRRIQAHRTNYKRYKEAFTQTLLKPNDTELKMDLQKYEDTLSILNIVIAREHAKIELKNKNPDLVTVEAEESTVKLVVKSEIKPQETNKKNGKFLGFDCNELDGKEKSEKITTFLDHKYNFTLANYSLSLMNNDKEVLVLSMTQFLASIEKHPELSTYKISTRAESFVIEGVSSENELVPLVTADNVLTGSTAPNFLAIDFEKKPLNSDFNYDISVSMEPIEATYHHYAVSEIINFFKINEAHVRETTSSAYRMCSGIKRKIEKLFNRVLARHLRINLKIDVKGPYIVFPQHGALQKEGYVLLLDTGRMTLRTELQAPDAQLEDATLMELEELLYDRLHLVFTDGQVLLCHTGDDWRDIRRRKESENHLVPKLHANVTVSSSIKPEYRVLPRMKVNVSVSQLKFNLSEGRLRSLVDFLNLLSIPSQDDIEAMKSSYLESVKQPRPDFFPDNLIRVRSVVALSSTVLSHKKPPRITRDLPNCAKLEKERSVISSEISEEDLEQLFRMTNVSGFDDIVSPQNRINLLLRFVIGELSFHFGYITATGRQKPYLILKFCTLYFESAIMEYGFALQSGIGTILLADKTEAGVTGSYLELISTDGSCEVFSVSYRKVKANCPDFKSHFRNVERSLTVNIMSLNVVFHRQAFMKLNSYCANLYKTCYSENIQNIEAMVKRNAVLFIKTECDPPIPPGAIKLSYSIRLNTFILKLCSKDADFLVFKIMGVENDCIYNVNERMMLRAHLTSLSIEDLGHITLYSKILTNEDDKVFDLKYVRHTPKPYKCSELDTNNEKVMSDGSFKLSIGRINCVFISKILSDCQHFLNPFVSFLRPRLAGYLRNFFFWSIAEFMRSEIKLQVSIDLQGPTFLLPQKKDYPNLLVFDIGTLTIENFLKTSELVKHVKINNESNICVIDNILIKLNSMTLSRAIMTLGGNLEIQEPIVEPMQLRFDIKRKIVDRKVVGRQRHDQCLCHIQGSLDTITMNLGQKDLASVFTIWEDNLSKTFLARKILGFDADSLKKKIAKNEDAIVKKLEEFFSQNEHPVCEINLRVILDGLQLNLFSDTEEVLSSPVRDLNHGLCKLVFGEMSTSLELFNNKSLSIKVSVRSCELEDMRKRAAIVKKIIQSPAKRMGINSDSGVYISMPPALDFSFTRTSTGDTCLDMLVEESRVNLCVPFLLDLGQYFLDSIPGEQIDEGVVNEGYECNDHEVSVDTEQEYRSSLDLSLIAEEQSGSSISIRVRKPELLLFSDLSASNAHAILFQAELMIESSRHMSLSSIVCTLSDVRAKSKSQQRYLRQSPHWVLLPCDVEICRKEQVQDVQITAIVSSIDLHLSVGTICTFTEIINEALNFFKRSDYELASHTITRDSSSQNDLWSPKPVSHIPYKETEKDFSSHSLASSECDSQIRVFELKPVSIQVQLEIEETAERISIIKAESEISGTISDWDSSNFQMQSSLKLYVYCYNVNTKTWEPFIGLCPTNDGHYLPWILTFKMYQDEAYSLSSWLNFSQQPIRKILPKKRKRELDSSEDEANEDMVFIPPTHVTSSKISVNYNFDCDDSDSDNNSDSEKLVKTFSHLFNKDTSDEEGSDSDESSKYEDEGLELTPECLAEPSNAVIETPIKRNARATYFIISAKDRVDFTVSPNTISLMEMIYSTYSKRKCDIPIVVTKSGKLNLQNNIGHASTIEFLIKEEGNSEKQARLIAARSFHESNSPASVPSSPENEPFSKIISPTSIVNIDCDLSDQNGISQDRTLQMFSPFADESLVNIYKKITSERLRIMVEGFDDVQIYCPKRRGCNQVALHPLKDGIRYYLIVEMMIDTHLHRTISVHSPFQIRNETSYAIGLHYKKQLAEKLQIAQTGQALNPFDDNMRMTIIEPDETYNVPLFIAYHFPIYVLPAYLDDRKYEVSEEGLCWRELSDDLYVPKDIYCKEKENDSSVVFGVKVICSKRQTGSHTNSQVPEYLIRMLPPLIFENKLPFVIDISIPCVDYEMRIEPGERTSVYCIKCNSATQIIFKIQNYLGTQWSGSFQLTSNLEKKCVKMFSDSESDFTKPFLLCVELNRLTNWVVDIYAQYWIVNKTGLPLSIRESHMNVMYEIPENELVVFSQKEKRRKRVIKLKAQQSGWSPSFNLDGISSMSLILCKDIERRRKYRILSESSISHLAPVFTKIVTFLPYFFISNNTKKALRFMEENEEADLWNDLLPGQGMAFWPYTESMKMRVKWKNSQLVSQHFDMTAVAKTVLRMDNGTALTVHIEGGSSSPFKITFQKFQDGDAPVRVDNLCNDLFLKINQINLGQATLLNPLQCLLYTWDDPTKDRMLMWNVYNSKTKGYLAQFSKDGYGEETVIFRTLKRSSTSLSKKLVLEDKLSVLGGSSNEDTDSDAEIEILKLDQVQNSKSVVYWVSYMEGEQRVLMFTQDESIFLKVRSIVEPEVSEKEVFFAISGIGLSLVANSNEECRELAYASVMDSAAHWEVFIGQKWKSLTLELSAWIENKYVNDAKKAQFENFIDIDLSKMYMTKPFFGKLRRTYSPGIWLHYRNSATFTYLQGHVHRMQIDNQLQEVSFPVMLHTSSQKSLTRVMENRKLKHFVEFCCLKQYKASCNIFKEVSLIVREFSLNLQEDFLKCLINNLFPKRLETKHTIAVRLRKDLSTVHVTPFCNKEKNIENQKTDIIEHLYISPITIHLKLLANTNSFNANQSSEVSDYCAFVKCMYDYACRGAFEKSAEFRLPAYETDCLKINNRQCFSNIWHYYTGKILQQFNVLILSVTVLGNPYGYNFKSPEESTYESDSIMVCEDEFAEKLSYDVSCILGHSTLDTMQTSHFTFQDTETNAFAVKAVNSYVENKDEPLSVLLINNSFSVDMELQISGLIIKPTDKTHQEELRCFFKSIGRSLLRLTKKEGCAFQTYPGLIMDTIKRAQEMGYKFVARARLPRYIDPYSGVELYSYHKAKGLHLLNVINKNCYSRKDSYWAHSALSNDGKHVALVSLRRIFLIEHRSIGEPWIVEWSIDINQLSEPPVVTGNKLALHINKDEKLSPVVDWYLESKEAPVLEWLCRKINIAMILNMESSTCPRDDA
ncbi:vacuolar protein sorting-associated protein 13C-like [Belonocnema kinseyi]|uniref:vacuolar protein sorting-associated protein 13C-like n=1 Tax=Belonocnema kinseyi TaxID=2817044 RepID=UPI00143D2119|nr:vacuolar protein sorting-associated protein 13C-like [Belonocnema kinseyi]